MEIVLEPPHNSFTLTSSSSFREEMIRLHGYELSSMARALPIPEEAPVTQMVFPLILDISTVLDVKYT